MEEHKIKVKVDTGKSVEDLNKLEQALNDVEAEAIPLTTQMGELEDQLMLMAHAGDTSSEKFMHLSTQVAGMRKTVRETDMQIEALSMTTSQKLGGALGGITGAFEMAQGVMGAFGAQGEEVEAALLKVQSAMAIAQGVTAIKESMNSFKALGAAVGLVSKAKQVDTAITATQAAVTTTATGATAGMSLAQKALNLVMSANPVFLIIGGITALIGALALFGTETKSAQRANDDFNKSLQETNEWQSEMADLFVGNAKQELALMQIRGASEKDLHIQRKEVLETEQVWRGIDATTQKEAIKQQQKLYKEALKNEEFELAATIREEIDASRQKWKTLGKQNRDYYKEVQLENETFKAEEKQKAEEAAKEAKDKRDAANEKYRADRKAAIDSIRILEKEYNDSLLSDHDLEVQKVNEKYAKEIALAVKYKQDVTLLEEAKKTALNEINVKEEQDRLKIIEDAELKIKEAKDKAKALELEAKLAFEAQILLIDEANTERITQSLMSNQEIELQAVQDKYFEIETLAQGNAEQMAIIAEARGAEEQAINEKYAEQKKQTNRDVMNASLDIAGQGMQLIAGIAEMSAGKSVAQQKKAFNIKKAADITSATIDGYKSVLSTYANAPGGVVLKAIQAAIAGGFAIMQIAKISKTKFEGGGGGGGSMASVPSGGGGGGAAASSVISPEFNIVGNSPINQLASLQAQPVNAYVVSGDMTSAQSLDRNRVQNATL